MPQQSMDSPQPPRRLMSVFMFSCASYIATVLVKFGGEGSGQVTAKRETHRLLSDDSGVSRSELHGLLLLGSVDLRHFV